MFGRSNRTKYQPSVTSNDKDWIEEKFAWFIEVFGLDKLREQPFILPTTNNFQFDDLKSNDQLLKLVQQLCKFWELDSNEIEVKVFDDFKSKQWTNLIPHGRTNEPGGLYTQIYTTEKVRFNIQLAKSNLENPQLLVSVLAHELAHVKLLGGNYIHHNQPDLEAMTDLTTIYFGFGIFTANSVQIQSAYWITRTGYLPDQLISYANALICYISGHHIEKYLPFFNINTNALFKKDYEFLINTHDTILTKEKITELEFLYKSGKAISEGFDKRNFDQVIDNCNKLLKLNPKGNGIYNNLGYALLLKKNYEEAIEQFTNAIDIDPYWDYPYNNRGYCKLQLGDLDNAFADLQSSFEMNPTNSFSWRNLGAFYLRVNEFEKALEYFEEAEKIDPKTEMINFYLAHTHQKLGNEDKAKQYMEKSNLLNEHNDSTINFSIKS